MKPDPKRSKLEGGNTESMIESGEQREHMKLPFRSSTSSGADYSRHQSAVSRCELIAKAVVADGFRELRDHARHEHQADDDVERHEQLGRVRGRDYTADCSAFRRMFARI